MFRCKNKKILYYRIWFTTLFILTVVFGAALIIYEDWQIEQDHISKYIPAQGTVGYLHINELLPSKYLSLAEVIDKNFSIEYEYLEKFNFKELSWLSYQQDGENYFGWFWYDRDNNFDYDILAAGWHAHKIDKIVVISSNSEFVERFKSYSVTYKNSIKKYLSDHNTNRGVSNFLYWNIREGHDLPDSLVSLAENEISGEWFFYLDKNNLIIEKLPRKIGLKLPFLNTDSHNFAQNFGDANVLIMNYDLEQNQNIFEQQDYLLNTYKVIENKYNFDTFDILAKTNSRHDLAFYLSGKDINGNNEYLWIGRGIFTKQGFVVVDEIIKTRMGWQAPVETKTVLPDNTEITEFKVVPVDFEYQTTNINGKSVKIVYFDKDSYFIWFKDGDFTVLGNSLKLINRYISQTKVDINNECIRNSSQLIKFDSNFSDNLAKVGIKNVFIGKNKLEFNDSYLICIE